MVASTVVRHLCAEIASIAHRTVSEGVAWQAGMLVLQDGSRRRFVAPALRTLPLGSEVEVSGTMEVHPQHGEQLRVLECHRVRPPTSPDGLKRFLAANITGLGATRAQRILSVLGTSAIDVLKADPVRLESIFPGLVGRQLVEAWRRWMRTEEADEAAIDIATSLTSAGVTYKTARRIVSFFRSPELADLILNEHPYRLMDVPGLGWERADALARKLGFAPDHPERLRAAAVHAMERAQANGHSALPVEELAEFVSELVGADHAEPAVTLALDAAEIVEDGERSYLPASLEAEWTIASRLRRHLMASLRMTTREESTRILHE